MPLKTMPPPYPSSSSGSDSDSDAPEAVSLSHSKEFFQQRNADICKAEVLLREKAKLKNRQRDQKLKERAANNKKDEAVSYKRKGKVKELLEEDGDEDEEGWGWNDAEARMLRAMEDAEGEGSEDEVVDGQDNTDGADGAEELQEGSSFDDVDVDGDDSDADSGEGSEEDEGEDEEMESQEESSEEDEEDEEMGSDVDSEPTTRPVSLKKPSNYLPDELFKAAFSQASKTQSSQLKSKSKQSTRLGKEQKKRKHTSSTPKDLMVGSKAIRTLSSTPIPGSTRAALSSAKINRFLNRTLALKGQKPIAGKGWERRPANIGVLRRNGPAAHFVRSR